MAVPLMQGQQNRRRCRCLPPLSLQQAPVKVRATAEAVVPPVIESVAGQEKVRVGVNGFGRIGELAGLLAVVLGGVEPIQLIAGAAARQRSRCSMASLFGSHPVQLLSNARYKHPPMPPPSRRPTPPHSIPS